ncbi:11196_t:CDS:1, partial [Racocetra persica]
KTKKVDLPNIFETTTQIADFLRQIKLRKLAINKSKKENILIKTLRPGEEIILDFNIIGEDEKSGISNEYSAESGKFLTEKEYLVEPIIVHYSTEKSSEKETCLIEKIIIKQREENDLTGLLTLKGTCSEVEKITEAEVDEIIITCCALTIKSYEIIPTTEATS